MPPSAGSLEIKNIMSARLCHRDVLFFFYPEGHSFFWIFSSFLYCTLPFEGFHKWQSIFVYCNDFHMKMNENMYFLKGQSKGYILLQIISPSHYVLHWTVGIIFFAQLISLTSRILINFTKVNAGSLCLAELFRDIQ